jgi:GxxExxY protein
MNEPSKEIDALAKEVVDAAVEVHRILGPGYLESVYEDALAIEMELRGIPFERQKSVNVLYKETSVGEGRLDLLVGGKLVVELKAVESLVPIHTAQVISYLKTIGQPVGLLLNFNASLLKQGIKRVVYTKH